MINAIFVTPPVERHPLLGNRARTELPGLLHAHVHVAHPLSGGEVTGADLMNDDDIDVFCHGILLDHEERDDVPLAQLTVIHDSDLDLGRLRDEYPATHIAVVVAGIDDYTPERLMRLVSAARAAW